MVHIYLWGISVLQSKHCTGNGIVSMVLVTHLSRVTHIWVGKLTLIDSDNVTFIVQA